MNTSTTCPCCSTSLLHHFGNHREYWFCRHCWEEMPILEITTAKENNHLKLLACLENFPVSNNHY